MQRSPLIDYIKEKINSAPTGLTPNPSVITISREYGCPGIPIANELSKAIAKETKREWNVVDKEIINQAAEELNIPPSLVDRIAKDKPKGVFEELFLSFSDSHLPSDIKVKKTVARIIRTVALHGDVIILGRGGVVLARDIKKSIHIHLHAPVSFRKERVKVLENLTSDNEAIGRIKVVDRDRVFLRNYFAGESLEESIFDISFNCERLSQEEIVQTVLKLVELKKL